MKSLEELAKGSGVPEDRLKAVLKNCQEKRTIHRNARKGWSYDKGKTLLAEGQIPMWLWLHPEFKNTFFSDEMDRKERDKAIQKFFRAYPELRTRD